jgi:putative transcriptional regulator
MLDPSSLDLSVLPWVPLEATAGFPSKPGIYFAIDSNKVVQYVGRSNNVRGRWRTHHRYDQLQAIGNVRIIYLFVNDPKLLPAVETALIEWFDPPLNVAGRVNDGTKSNRPSVYCRLAVLMAEKDPQLSQRQLARDTSLDITTINRLYTNNFSRVDVSTIEVLCNYFDKGIGDLLEMRDPENIPKRKSRKRNQDLEAA